GHLLLSRRALWREAGPQRPLLEIDAGLGLDGRAVEDGRADGRSAGGHVRARHRDATDHAAGGQRISVDEGSEPGRAMALAVAADVVGHALSPRHRPLALLRADLRLAAAGLR